MCLPRWFLSVWLQQFAAKLQLLRYCRNGPLETHRHGDPHSMKGQHCAPVTGGFEAVEKVHPGDLGGESRH